MTSGPCHCSSESSSVCSCERILSEHLPRDDSRTELPTVTALLVLFANLLMAREPVYGVGEWAALFPPTSSAFASRI